MCTVIPLSLSEIAAVTKGRLHGARGTEVVTAVEFDSRAVRPGGLFLALPGERVDGHAFARAAVERGAVGVLAARPVDAPAVVVPPFARVTGTYLGESDADGSGAAVLAALARLATHVVGRLPQLTVVGVTGSSGKTSTKDLLAAVLAPLGPTVAPPESFNNELGLPWTALRADADTRHLVLEFSARGAGHIAALAAAVPPRIGVVLNVGSAHLGEFGSVEAIARAKGELVEALPAGGVAVLNADDPRVAAMATRTSARVVTFGSHGDVRAEALTLDGGRARFRLVTPTGAAPVALRLVGAHHVGNALAAAAVASELGGAPEAVAAALSAAVPASRWRMEVTDRADGVTIVNDAYNANPDSMAAALRALAALGRGRRTWAVLGPMRELGPETAAAHADIARLVKELGVQELVTVDSPEYGAGRPVADVPAATALLRAEVAPGDVVLVKASRAAGLDRIAAALLGGNA
jgi:UDP-N-acetylmuramoyl-tripeptide--D-alanyl-D-alanine ligase